MQKLKHFLPHVGAIIGFIVVALFFFYPVMQNKKIYQSDIVQYIGMAKEQMDFREQSGEEPYWTNSAFGGMPTYQLGAKYPHHYIKSLDSFLRFLPRPADYLFLYFLGIYLLLSVLRIPPLKAFFVSLAFGLSTYLIIILGVGHNAKAHAIAYMPALVAGVILVFQKRYFWGFVLTLLAAALEIQANHFQMTYYLLFLLLFLGFGFYYKLIKDKDWKAVYTSLLIFALSGILSVGLNATNLLATAEYADFSTRGKTELSITPDGKPVDSKTGMSFEYITEYSYGKAESFNLIAPRLFGGSNSETLGTDSQVYAFLISLGAPSDQALEFANQMPTYWGEQPIVAAPAYIGAVVFVLFLLSFFTVKRRIRYVFLAGAILSLLLSWGKHFSFLTEFFINYIPLYNKFRAVSSIQVILELCVPVLGALGWYGFYRMSADSQKKALIWVSSIAGGLLLLLWIASGSFTYTGGSDTQLVNSLSQMYDANFAHDMLSALKEDRKEMYLNDLAQTAVWMLAAMVIFYLYTIGKVTKLISIVGIGVILVADVAIVAKRYVNEESFVPARVMDEPFQPTAIDFEIMKDEDLHFRIFDTQSGMSNARNSYFHKSLSGYSAVKPRRIQQLYDFHLAKGHMSAYNMLNVKYIIRSNQGQEFFSLNPFANGNAWFVSEPLFVDSADQEIKLLDSLDTRNQFIVNRLDFPEWAKTLEHTKINADSTQTITLTSYKPNRLAYKVNSDKSGIAVFSEVYYPKGWKAFVDEVEVPIYRVNYVLRAINLPANAQKVEFIFDPEVVKKGTQLQIWSALLAGVLIVLFGFWYFKKSKTTIL